MVRKVSADSFCSWASPEVPASSQSVPQSPATALTPDDSQNVEEGGREWSARQGVTGPGLGSRLYRPRQGHWIYAVPFRVVIQSVTVTSESRLLRQCQDDAEAGLELLINCSRGKFWFPSAADGFSSWSALCVSLWGHTPPSVGWASQCRSHPLDLHLRWEYYQNILEESFLIRDPQNPF